MWFVITLISICKPDFFGILLRCWCRIYTFLSRIWPFQCVQLIVSQSISFDNQVFTLFYRSILIPILFIFEFVNVELSRNIKYEWLLLIHPCKFVYDICLLIFCLYVLDVSVFISNFVDEIKGYGLILWISKISDSDSVSLFSPRNTVEVAPTQKNYRFSSRSSQK